MARMAKEAHDAIEGLSEEDRMAMDFAKIEKIEVSRWKTGWLAKKSVGDRNVSNRHTSLYCAVNNVAAKLKIHGFPGSPANPEASARYISPFDNLSPIDEISREFAEKAKMTITHLNHGENLPWAVWENGWGGIPEFTGRSITEALKKYVNANNPVWANEYWFAIRDHELENPHGGYAVCGGNHGADYDCPPPECWRIDPIDTESPAPVNSRPCLSWRTPGGFWQLKELGKGEHLGLTNSSRPDDINRFNLLDDQDLIEIRDLIDHALKCRGEKPHA